jgi:transposase
MVLLPQQGYMGSERTLCRYLSAVRVAQGLPTTRVKPPQGLAQVSDPQASPLTKRQVAYLILKRVEHRDSQDIRLLAQIVAQHSNLALAVELADKFLQLLRQQQADDSNYLPVYDEFNH